MPEEKENMPLKTEIHKRKIGSVMIFDVFGEVSDGEIDALKDFMERNIQRGGVRSVILNTQNVTRIDELALRKILIPLERPHRKAVFCSNPEIAAMFRKTYLPEKTTICCNEAEISDTFGLYLVEKDKFIFKGERRKSKRIDVAIPTAIQIRTAEGDAVKTSALITNLSQGGFFAQYLDLEHAGALKGIRDLRNRQGQVIFRPPFGNAEQKFEIEPLRVETSSRQTGMAAKFRKKS